MTLSVLLSAYVELETLLATSRRYCHMAPYSAIFLQRQITLQLKRDKPTTELLLTLLDAFVKMNKVVSIEPGETSAELAHSIGFIEKQVALVLKRLNEQEIK